MASSEIPFLRMRGVVSIRSERSSVPMRQHFGPAPTRVSWFSRYIPSFGEDGPPRPWRFNVLVVTLPRGIKRAEV
ncbi:predicted protein [Chaetomium globosum CBS 148.51]|uniref:Uncharacterized protein n=1 Tax=Chaetomium globosum (strain ATCC 6205 / CBS 148.51 / DSM 1962 / NBRC 6347 / NRRL 1970) TaxID=306901 RepID=Q2H5I4_CHAGB|nr:uncharacterized protein CHGG_06081 [Chaetomium globosum CBS 148.51]EAQ89462.1 predicted protein [Chaetomium globosum CBS 148.51]